MWAGVLLLAGLTLPSNARAQFLRVGPFDFTAKAKVGLNWSDNVDGVRPVEQDKRPDDFYLTWSFDLNSATPAGRDGLLTLDAGVEAEDYFRRDDLDTADLGRIRAELTKSMRRLKLNTFVGWEHTLEMEEDVYYPGISRFRRNPHTLTEYGGGAEWIRAPLTLKADYEFARERYDYEEFRIADNDETTISMTAEWRFGNIGDISYELEKTLTEYVQQSDDNPEWTTTEKILVNLDQPFRLFRRPQVTLSLGVEKEDDLETGKKGEWDPIYTLDIKDSWELGSRLTLSANANYEYDQDPEGDDIIGWTYLVKLDHEVTPQIRHGLAFEREPRDTFNSRSETDTTTYTYTLRISDIITDGLSFTLDSSYERNQPLDGPEERITTHELKLAHTREISRRLRRSFTYTYSLEESNLEDELLIINLVEWVYSYDF